MLFTQSCHYNKKKEELIKLLTTILTVQPNTIFKDEQTKSTDLGLSYLGLGRVAHRSTILFIFGPSRHYWVVFYMIVVLFQTPVLLMCSTRMAWTEEAWAWACSCRGPCSGGHLSICSRGAPAAAAAPLSLLRRLPWSHPYRRPTPAITLFKVHSHTSTHVTIVSASKGFHLMCPRWY